MNCTIIFFYLVTPSIPLKKKKKFNLYKTEYLLIGEHNYSVTQFYIL